MSEENNEAIESAAALANEERRQTIARIEKLGEVVRKIEEILIENSVSVKEWNVILDRFGTKLNVLYEMTFKELKDKYE